MVHRSECLSALNLILVLSKERSFNPGVFMKVIEGSLPILLNGEAIIIVGPHFAWSIFSDRLDDRGAQ